MPMSKTEMGNHFFASSELKSRYVITPALLQDWIAMMHTTLWRPVSQPSSVWVWARPGVPAVTYLYTQQEEVQVEVQSAQHVFVGHGHQNTAAAVRQYGKDRAVGYSHWIGHRLRSRLRSCFKMPVGLLVAELNGVVFSLLVVCHGW